MDVDFLLEKNGRFLVMEFKPEGVALQQGQRIALKNLVRKDFDVWVVRQGKTFHEVRMLDGRGDEGDPYMWTSPELAFAVSDWLKEAGA
jgi:hypothetical protein